MGRKRSFLGFLATLVLALFTANAFAEGYSCPTYKKYTTCNVGYYLTSAEPGNECADCTTISNTEDYGGVTIDGGVRERSCNGTYTSSLGNDTVGTGACTECSNYVYNCECNDGYSAVNQGAESCTCVQDTFTITVQKNGGTGALSVVDGTNATGTTDLVFQCTSGDIITMPIWGTSSNTLTKTNSVFTGWSESSFTCSSDKTITAQWSDCANCVAGEGVSTCSDSVVNNACKSTVTSCENGYENGVCTGNECTCSVAEYTIHIARAGGVGALTVNGRTDSTYDIYFTCQHGQTFTLPEWDGTTNAMAKSGYVFTGWDAESTVTCTADRTITAQWGTCATASVGDGVESSENTGIVDNTCTYLHMCKAGYWNASHNTTSDESSISCTQCPINYRDGAGTTSEKYCLGTFKRRGEENACSQPANSQSYECATCTPETCEYTKYYNGQVVSNCTPTNCTQDVASYTCLANYYDNGAGSCSKCGDNSSTSAGNSATACTCVQGYSADGTPDGAKTTTSAACKAVTYTITYNLNQGTNYTGAPANYTYGVGATINGTPTRTGYTFEGWCTDANLTQNCAKTQTISTTDTGIKEFWAKWSANKYTVTYACGSGTTGSAPANGTATYNQAFTPAANTCVKDGFDFGGWNDGSTIRAAGTAFTWTYTSNKTFTATWNPKGATTITYNKDGGTINGNYTTACNVETATFALPTDVTKPGYTFAGWYNESGSKVETVAQGTCTGALTFTAKWDACNSTTDGACNCATGTYPVNGTCTNCTKSCASVTGYPDGEYNVCQAQTDAICTRTCTVDDVANSATVGGTVSKGGTVNCYALSCQEDYYLTGASGQTACEECPANSEDNCGVDADWSCNEGYEKTADGKGCKPKTYTVTLDNQGATTAGTTSVTATFDTILPNITVPTKTDYEFGGYYDAKNCSGTQYYNAAGTGLKAWTTANAGTLYACWVLDVFYCEAGKAADGTACSAGYFCPGDKVAAGTENDTTNGCERKCPSATGKTVTSTSGATLVTQCSASGDVDIYESTNTTVTGSGTKTCSWDGDSYDASCNTVPKSCIGGYYRPADNSPFCNPVGYGYYRGNSDGIRTRNLCSDLSGADSTVTTKTETSSAATACYNTCSAIKTTDGNGVRNPVNATENYNGTTIPVCSYTTSCNGGYSASGDACVAETYKITLNHNGGTSGTNVIYLKYGVAWMDASGNTITTVEKPVLSGQTFGGYLAGNTVVVDATGAIVGKNTLFEANATITATWSTNPTIACKAGTYYPGTGASCVPCTEGSFCEGVSAVQETGEAGRTTCASLNGKYTAAVDVNGNEMTVTISSAAESDSAEDCFATNVAYTPNQYTAGSQTCMYDETAKSYTVGCSAQTVITCAGGYALATDTAVVCTPVGYGYYSPDKVLSATQCPPLDSDSSERGTTQSTTARSSEDCIIDNLWFENDTSGQRRQCFWTEASGAYDQNCPQSTVVTCIAGYWYDASLFASDSTDEKYCVPVGDGAWSPAQSECDGEDLHPTAVGCSTKKNMCPGGATTGREDASSVLHCEGVCPENSYCVDGVEYSCSVETGGEYPLSQAGSDEIGDCYKEGCTQRCSKLDSVEVGTELCVPRGTTYSLCSYYQGHYKTPGVNYQSAPTVCAIHPEKTLAETCPVTLVVCPLNHYYTPVNDFDTGTCQPCSSLALKDPDAKDYTRSTSGTHYEPNSETGEKACYTIADLMCTQPICPLEGTGSCSYDSNQKISGGGYLFYGTTVALPGVAKAFMCDTTWACNAGYDTNPNANINPTDSIEDTLPEELCTPHVYTMTLDAGYDEGTDVTLYQKYKDAWYSDASATDKITTVPVLERENYTLQGYFTAPSLPANMVFDANGGFIAGDAINAKYTEDKTFYAVWSQDVYQCEAGKYYEANANGTDSVLKDCVAPYYCPGVGTVAVGATGCRSECPTPQVTPMAAPATIADGQTSATSCYANFAQNPLSGDELANGDGTWVCQYSGTSTQGEYANCNVVVNSCDAGYYNQSGTATCTTPDSGYYSPDGDLVQTKCPAKTNYTIGTDVLRDAIEDCYVVCSTYVPTVEHSTDVYVTAGEEYSKMFYTDGAYPACQYTVECETGYTAVSGVAPQCKAKEYEITLDKNGGTGDIADVVRCTFDGGDCALPATSVLKRTGYNTANKWCANADGTGACYDAGTIASGNISQNGTNTKLYAIWTPGVFKVNLSAPDATENAAQGPVYLKYATGWYSDAAASKAISSIGTALPVKDGTSYNFAGYKLNDIQIVYADGTLAESTDALTATSVDNATAMVQWTKGVTTCQPGYYYTGTGSDVEGCVVCKENHWCPGGSYGTDSGTVGGLNPCENGGLSDGGANATNIGVCYKEGMAYVTYIDTAKSQRLAEGTWTCNWGVIAYDNCHEDTIDIDWCAAGYWYDEAQTTINCVAVGADNWSAEAELVKYACPDDGNTNGATTSDALTDCQKRVDTYVSETNLAKGSHVCSARQDGNVVKYDQNCQAGTIEIAWCEGGYWYDESQTKTDCVEVGIGRYSPEGDMLPYDCPAGGTTTTTNASTPHGVCQKTKTYPGIEYTGPAVHGTGVHGCLYDQAADGMMFGDEKSDGYVSCGTITMTKCDAGYWWQNGETVCKVVDYNHFGPVADANNSGYPTGRMACPDNGLTLGAQSADATACYLEQLACNVNNGTGEQTRFYDSAAVSDTAGYNVCFANGQNVDCDTVCTITGCENGFTLIDGACINCPENHVCTPEDGQRTCADATGGTHTKADAGTTDVAYCYSDCAVIENAYQMSGRDYYGANVADTCKIEVCAAGYTMSNGQCIECPAGMVCDPSSGDDTPKSCATLTGGEHTESAAKSDSINDCYKVCEPYEVVNGTAVPKSDKAYYPNDCEFTGVSVNGNPCEIVNGVCIETSCSSSFEMVNGICKPCAREHAISYKPTGNCVVESCASGYHPNGQQCEEDVIECSAPNAVAATQTWIASKNAFGACVITECEDGYHLGENACQVDEQVCELEHGIGTREWNHKTNRWGDCIATKCDPGYTNDPSLTNELWEQCGRCNNMYSANGELAASSYVQGCEIAACMYQGELYTLENNECRLICDTYSDETGSRRWNASRGKCERTCEPGYTSW